MSLYMDAFGTGGFATIDLILWIVGIAIIIGIGFWLYVNKFSYKYLFVEFDKKGNFQLRKAKMSKNKKGIKKFILKLYNSPEHHLAVKQHNGIFNGKPVRFVCWDGMGFLTYATTVQIKNNCLNTSLMPIERVEAVDSQMEAYLKDNSMPQGLKMLYTGIIFFGFLTLITALTVGKYTHELQVMNKESAISFDSADKKFNSSAETYNDHTKAMSDLVYVLEKIKAK